MEHPEIYNRLVQAARARALVNYADLAKVLGIHMKGRNWAAPIGRILGRISEDEVAAGRPMLSAVVVSKGTDLPGAGFFALGQQLRQTLPGEDDIAFAKRELRLVYDYWSREAVSSP